MMASKQECDIRVPCRFGNLSIGAEKATIAVTIDRSVVTVERLEPVVVGGRLDVLLRYDRNGQREMPDQRKLVETADEITSIANCPSLMIKLNKLTFRLSFALGSVDVKQLAGAAQMVGEIGMTRIGDSGEDGDDD